MMRLPLSATGPAAPDLVWERYRDLRLWSTWSPQVQGVDAPSDVLAAGLRGHVVGPLGVRLPFEVLTVDPDARAWRWRVRVGFVDATLDHTVDPASRPGGSTPGSTSGNRSGTGSGGTRGGTRTGLVIEAPSAFALAYAPVARLALGRLVRP